MDDFAILDPIWNFARFVIFRLDWYGWFCNIWQNLEFCSFCHFSIESIGIGDFSYSYQSGQQLIWRHHNWYHDQHQNQHHWHDDITSGITTDITANIMIDITTSQLTWQHYNWHHDQHHNITFDITTCRIWGNSRSGIIVLRISLKESHASLRGWNRPSPVATSSGHQDAGRQRWYRMCVHCEDLKRRIYPPCCQACALIACLSMIALYVINCNCIIWKIVGSLAGGMLVHRLNGCHTQQYTLLYSSNSSVSLYYGRYV